MDLAQKVIKFVAIYVRVSTSKQEDENTVQNQIMVLEEKAAENGWIIIEKYIDDGWSGDTLVRPELDRMRLDASDKKWDAVLIYDPDRLARRYSYQELVMDELQEKEIPVIFYTIPAPKNQEDKLLYGVKGLFAQYERFKISERFRLGKLRVVREGHVLGSSAPYGYKYIRKNKDNGILHGFYEIVDDEARVIRMMFEWIVYEKATVRGIIKRLKELGIKPRKSKKGTWATSTLSRLLKNTSYIGTAQWGKSYAVVPENPYKDEKYKKIKKSSRKNKPQEEWIPIPVPAIVDEELFEKAQKQLAANYDLCDRNRKKEYLLANKLFCTCGKRRCGGGSNGGTGGKHFYYRCNSRIQSYPLPAECKEGGFNAEIADDLVWKRIEKLLSNSDLLIQQTERWLDTGKGKEKVATVDLEVMRKEIENLKQKEDRYNKAYADGVFDLPKLKEYTAPIREKVNSLEYQIARSRQEQEENKMAVPSPYEVEEFAKEAKGKLKNLNFSSKRAIVLNVIDKIIGTPEKLSVYGYIPLNIKENQNVTLCSKHRDSRFAECGEVHTL